MRPTINIVKAVIPTPALPISSQSIPAITLATIANIPIAPAIAIRVMPISFIAEPPASLVAAISPTIIAAKPVIPAPALPKSSQLMEDICLATNDKTNITPAIANIAGTRS